MTNKPNLQPYVQIVPERLKAVVALRFPSMDALVKRLTIGTQGMGQNLRMGRLPQYVVGELVREIGQEHWDFIRGARQDLIDTNNQLQGAA